MQTELNLSLQASTTFLWTPHCGIIMSFNPLLILQPLDITLNDRLIVCQVSHANAIFPPFTLVNIYTPANFTARVTFFREILTMSFFNLYNMWARDPMTSHEQRTI